MSTLEPFSARATIEPLTRRLDLYIKNGSIDLQDVAAARDLLRKQASEIDAQAYNKTLRTVDWVNCPICGEPDMRKSQDKEGNELIDCVNHACLSNGGTFSIL